MVDKAILLCFIIEKNIFNGEIGNILRTHNNIRISEIIYGGSLGAIKGLGTLGYSEVFSIITKNNLLPSFETQMNTSLSPSTVAFNTAMFAVFEAIDIAFIETGAHTTVYGYTQSYKTTLMAMKNILLTLGVHIYTSTNDLGEEKKKEVIRAIGDVTETSSNRTIQEKFSEVLLTSRVKADTRSRRDSQNNSLKKLIKNNSNPKIDEKIEDISYDEGINLLFKEVEMAKLNLKPNITLDKERMEYLNSILTSYEEYHTKEVKKFPQFNEHSIRVRDQFKTHHHYILKRISYFRNEFLNKETMNIKFDDYSLFQNRLKDIFKSKFFENFLIENNKTMETK